MEEKATHVLLAEDDVSLGQLLADYLVAKGFRVTWVQNGADAWVAFLNHEVQVAVLDVMMPKKDGFSLAMDIRRLKPTFPFLFLTAKSMPEDAIKGLEAGADDYLTKPFHMEELVLRIRAILRRSGFTPLPEVFRIGTTYQFDPTRQTLSFGDQITKLTTKETELLKLFCLHENQTLNRSIALKKIWGDDSYFNARSMDVYVTKLRKLLRLDPSLQIQNLHGEGFRLITA